MVICDEDCFHCKFPDCMWDGRTKCTPGSGRLGDRIRAARLAAGYNQKQLAEKIGVRPALLSLWETNASGVSEKNMAKLYAEFPELRRRSHG